MEGRGRAVTDYDLAAVDAGIVGLAHSLTAAKHDLSLVDRDPRTACASIEKFRPVVTGREPVSSDGGSPAAATN